MCRHIDQISVFGTSQNLIRSAPPEEWWKVMKTILEHKASFDLHKKFRHRPQFLELLQKQMSKVANA